MPKKRQENVRKYGYSNEAMEKAMAEVRQQGNTIKEAARRHGINRSTLINH